VKHHFFHHARKDESTGEHYMTEDDFINAIAPKHEDYVSCALFLL
jgi:solute carrier family 25 aspartate/glutamate transporter 12/13